MVFENTLHEPRRILIADDTASSRDLLRSILEVNGYVVEEAQDGQQVLEIIEFFQPHLAILDLHMPHLDGYATASAIRKMPMFQRLPMVALTAAVMQTVPDRIAEAGFSSYLIKPIRPSNLRQCVAALLQIRDA